MCGSRDPSAGSRVPPGQCRAGILPAQVQGALNCSAVFIRCSEGQLTPTPAVKCHLSLSRAAVPLRGQGAGDSVCVQVQAGSLKIRNLLQEA